MVSKSEGYEPSVEEKIFITKHMGQNTICDSGYQKIVNLTQTEAQVRKEAVSEVEYNFSVAILRGKYYFAKSEINFYLEKEVEEGVVFLEL